MTETMQEKTMKEKIEAMSIQLCGILEELKKPTVGEYVRQQNTPAHRLMETLDAFKIVEVERIRLRVADIQKRLSELEA